MENEGTTSSVRSEALAALNESSRRSRRQSPTNEPSSGPSERSTDSATEQASSTPKRAADRSQEYVAQYPIKTVRGENVVILQPGDSLTPEEVSSEAGLAKLMSTGFVVTKPVWEAKMAALQAQEDARAASAEYEGILDEQSGIG